MGELVMGYLPKFKPGQTLPVTASADVRAGRLVAVSGNWTVAEAAENSAVVGVAGQDTKAGEVCTVHRGGVQELIASAAVAAGAEVSSASEGRAGAGTKPIGQAMTAATEAGDKFLAWIN